MSQIPRAAEMLLSRQSPQQLISSLVSFRDLLVLTEECYASFVPGKGRIITLSKERGDVRLCEISRAVLNLLSSRGCPFHERFALKTLSERITRLYQETDSACKAASCWSACSDWAWGLDEAKESAFWGQKGLQLANSYSLFEWIQAFPGREMSLKQPLSLPTKTEPRYLPS